MTVTWLTHRRIDRPSVGFVFDTRHAFFGMDFSLSLSLSLILSYYYVLYTFENMGDTNQENSNKQYRSLPLVQ